MTEKNLKPIGQQYLFRSAFGDEVWRDSPAPYNGQRSRGSRPIFTEPPEAVIVVRMLADKMMTDEILRHRFDDAEHRLIASAVGAIGRGA